MQLDLGDITLAVTATVKGLRPPRLVRHWGAPKRTTPGDRVAGPRPPYLTPPERIDLIMDLQADKKVAFTLQAVDELGNPTSFDGSIAYAVDRPDLLNLVDNGDGSGEIAATGVLGTAMLTATITPAVGAPTERVEAINVIPGDAAAFAFAFDEPQEVTPDV